MKVTFNTEIEALQRVAEIDALCGYPDLHSGTLTYAVPTLNEESQMWEFEEGTDVPKYKYSICSKHYTPDPDCPACNKLAYEPL